MGRKVKKLIIKKYQKIKNRIGILILIFILISTLVSCGENQTKKETPLAGRTVVDCIGRKVIIPEHIERVGCLYAFAGHVTALLGEEDKIVAVVDGLKRDKLLTNLFPDILDKAVPFADGSINIEELVKLDPDLVFIRETTAENQSEMDKLETFGIPALVVDSNTMEEQRDSVRLAGEVFGGSAMEKARQYDRYFQEAIDTAGQKAAQLNPDQKVTVFHSINEATRTDAGGTLPAQWTSLVGVDNVAADKELNPLEGKMYASLEQIYLWDPQIIICNEPGVAEYILSDNKWAGLQAVRNKMVYQMPIAISRWGHPGSMETPLAVYWLGKLAYPALYADVDLVQKTKEFYKTFFNYDLSNDQVSMILSGEGIRKEKGQ